MEWRHVTKKHPYSDSMTGYSSKTWRHFMTGDGSMTNWQWQKMAYIAVKIQQCVTGCDVMARHDVIRHNDSPTRCDCSMWKGETRHRNDNCPATRTLDIPGHCIFLSFDHQCLRTCHTIKVSVFRSCSLKSSDAKTGHVFEFLVVEM